MEQALKVLKKEGTVAILENTVKDDLALAEHPYVRDSRLAYVRVELAKTVEDQENGLNEKTFHVFTILEGTVKFVSVVVRTESENGVSYEVNSTRSAWDKLAKEAVQLANE